MEKIQVASFEPDTDSIFYSLKKDENINSVKDILKKPIILNIDGKNYKFHEFKDSIQITENKLKILENIIENKKTLNENKKLDNKNDFILNNVNDELKNMEKLLLEIEYDGYNYYIDRNDYKDISYTNLESICETLSNIKSKNDDVFKINNLKITKKNYFVNLLSNYFHFIIGVEFSKISNIMYKWNELNNSNNNKIKDQINKEINVNEQIVKKYISKINDNLDNIIDNKKINELWKSKQNYFCDYILEPYLKSEDIKKNIEKIKNEISNTKNNTNTNNLFGIQNLGNTCYINSVIQFLLAFKPMELLINQNENEINKYFDNFISFVNLVNENKKFDSSGVYEKPNENIFDNDEFYKKLNNKYNNIYNQDVFFTSVPFIDKIKKVKEIILEFKKFIENRNNETLYKLVEIIQKSVNFQPQIQQDPTEVLDKTDIINILMYLGEYMNYNYFYNQSEVRYYKDTDSNTKKNLQDPKKNEFMYLQIPLGKNKDKIDISVLINKTVLNEETIDSKNNVRLDNNKNNFNQLKEFESKQAIQYKKTYFTSFLEDKYPEQIILTLKRFSKDNNSFVKNMREIDNFFNISINFTSLNSNNTENKIKYDLNSVIIHDGTINGGHYYTYKKINNNWYEFNDSSIIDRVDYNSIEDNISTNGYIFLYDKKNN